MRVIAGAARGRKLEMLKGDEVRPTTDKVKEAIFSAIQFRISGAKCLDLFSGSGQIGIELLSRGAEHVTFVDNSRHPIEITKKNIEAVGFSEKSNVVFGDSISFLNRCKEKFDITYLDPPYGGGLLEKALETAGDMLTEKGLLICEYPSDCKINDEYYKISLDRKYSYGKIHISTFVKCIHPMGVYREKAMVKHI